MEKDIAEILKSKTEMLLKETMRDGTLNFFYDQTLCRENELVRIWKNELEVVLIDDAVKFDGFGKT